MSLQFEKRPCRPRNHLAAAGKLYPAAWQQVDEFRAGRGQDLPAWPDWCFLPLAGWYAIVSADAGVNRLSMDQIPDVSRLAALGTWRVTQGIYRFDPALYDAIIDTPIDGDLPCDVLYRMPEWCIYIETPGMQWQDSPLYGFWAHLECDMNNGRHELRILTDAELGLIPLVLHMGSGSLAEAIKRALSEAQRQMPGLPVIAQVSDTWQSALEPIMNLLLYVCSENAEIDGKLGTPVNPAPKKTKRGWRLFPAESPSTWDVGVRIGAALRRAYHAAETEIGGTNSSPRPHIRRAHWHGFRSGAMKTSEGMHIPAENRKFELRWLPPIPVNLDDVSGLPATVRPVK
jgi:hypothetical protein